MKETWVILGATSIIAQEFAHIVAEQGHPLLLVARNEQELAILAADYRLRYKIECTTQTINFANKTEQFSTFLSTHNNTLFLFIAYSEMLSNAHLDVQNIETLIDVNIKTVITLIYLYLKRSQSQHRLLFLSSVAACRGRAKNSLYGASKRAVEVYLEGMQQMASHSQVLTIARLGFIDTVQTFGEKGVILAASPKYCAYRCYRALMKKKTRVYIPFFWRAIMLVITLLPNAVYKKFKL